MFSSDRWLATVGLRPPAATTIDRRQRQKGAKPTGSAPFCVNGKRSSPRGFAAGGAASRGKEKGSAPVARLRCLVHHWMPRVGFEPTRVLAHASLSRARLPVPPPRLGAPPRLARALRPGENCKPHRSTGLAGGLRGALPLDRSLKPTGGIEPPTSFLPRTRSTPELRGRLGPSENSDWSPCSARSGREDSNLRPHRPERCALTGLRYSP